MANVRNFGKGYYGVETEGVTISSEVQDTIQKAFDTAKSIPEEEIKVHTTDESSSKDGETGLP
jgi:hypothetical protein